MLDWGWRPHSLTISDEEVATLALRNLRQDPADWGGGGLEPDEDLLLQVLTGNMEPDEESHFLLELTIDAFGLPSMAESEPFAWRIRCLPCLLVTQAHSIAPDRIPADHALLIADDRRSLALQLVQRWEDSRRYASDLPEAVIQADRIAGLRTALSGLSIKMGRT